MKSITISILLVFIVAVSSSQTNSKYDKHDVFDPMFLSAPGSEFRSASGKPGPAYWQNNTDYLIKATLNEKDTTISGEVIITYTNNSPDQLEYLWLQLDQNLLNRIQGE